jgi:hypothetical protein
MCSLISFNGVKISGNVKLDSPVTLPGFQTPSSQGWLWKMNRRLALPGAAKAWPGRSRL